MASMGHLAPLGKYPCACQIDTWGATPGACLEYETVRAQ